MGDLWKIKDQYKRQMGSLWSRGDRGIVMGGDQTPAKVNVIDYITISTTGNSTDFGDLTSVKASNGTTGSSTRAFCFGGYTPAKINVIEYVTFSSMMFVQLELQDIHRVLQMLLIIFQ